VGAFLLSTFWGTIYKTFACVPSLTDLLANSKVTISVLVEDQGIHFFGQYLVLVTNNALSLMM
jgi:hypothetical protein